MIARNSTFAYKGQSPDVRTVAKELGARYVLEGTIRRAGNRVRVAGQLIDAHTGHHVWADRFDRELEDIFALQDEIAQRIAAIVEPTMEREERNRIVAKRPSELSAWEFCLRGISLLNEETEEATRYAREMFRRAIEHDPYYSRAHTGLALSYSHDLRFGWFETREASLDPMFDAARRAITLDEASWEAQAMLVRAYIHARQPEAALTEAKKAVELNPHSAHANQLLGVTLSLSLGRADEGIPWLERAIDLNPLDPRNHQFKVYLATAHLCANRFVTAIEYAEDAIRRRPDFVDGCIVLASAFGHLSRAKEACTAIGSLAEIAWTSVERHEIWAESVKEHVLDGLRKAGLPE